MASRNYGLAFDTPYNERLLSVLEKYDRNRDTNGEPDIFGDTMQGGAFLGADGRVHTTGLYHPHLSHPMLGAMAREMDGGKFSFGKALGSVGKVALPIATKVGTKVAEKALMSALAGAGVGSGGGVYSAGAMYRPAGMVSPFIHQPNPFSLVQSGTMATYPAYNAVEMRSLNGGACCGMCASGGKFNFGKALGSVAKGVGKVALPIATKVGTKVAEDALMSALAGSGVGSGGKFNFGKALGSVAKGVGKVALPIATKVGTKVAEDALMSALAGAGKKPRGRPRKMVSGANSAMGASGGKFSIGKALGSVAKGVGKVAVPIATKVGTKMAEDALTSYMSGKGVMSAGVGEMKRPRGRPRKMDGGKFDIFDTIKKIGTKAGSPFEKSVGVNPFTMGFDLGKDVIAPALMGKGVRSGGGDGRKKRAEIVKRVMKEQGLKMTDASKYVKAHGLY
jgi:hypothetical protein